jgi:hypothetical protein
VELGNGAFDTCDPQTGQKTFLEVNRVPCAIPRLR